MKFTNTLNSKKMIFLASFATALIMSLMVVSPAIATVKQGMDMHANCIGTEFPDSVEREITINPDTETIFVAYEVNGIQKETTLSYAKDSKISDCSEGARLLISEAKGVVDKMNLDTCIELKEIVSGARPVPDLDGKKMNLVAANTYIKNHCQI